MSAIIIGGNECMGRTYCELCAKYNITARTIPLKKGSFANQLMALIDSFRYGHARIRQMDVSALVHGNVAILSQIAHGNRNRRLGYRKPIGYVNGPRIAFCFMQAQDHLQIIFR